MVVTENQRLVAEQLAQPMQRARERHMRGIGLSVSPEHLA